MSKQIFLKCKHCNNLVGIVNNAGTPIVCCGEPMEVLAANTVDAAVEKHIPEVTVSGNTVTVQVGSVMHPMTEEHHIEFIYLETKHGGQRKALKAGAEPCAVFELIDDTLIAVFAYCNLHGLWKVDM